MASRMARCGQPAVDEHDHPIGHPLHLLEHVAADDHGPALRAEPAEQADEVVALDGVGAVQRLVEHEHEGVGDERGRHLRPLAHALAEPAHPAVGDVQHPDGGERLLGRLPLGHPVEVGDVVHELAGRERLGDGLVLGDERDPALGLPVAPRVAPGHPHLTGVDADQPGDGPHEGGLAGAVRPEQPGHPWPERARQLGQRHLLAEPHGHVRGRHGGVADEGGVGHYDVSVHR
jgi:hypothetical protein